jgi:hypothetical protein
MNNLKWMVPLIVLCIALAGCPYSSKVSIDNPSVKINNALLGTWEPKTSSEDRYMVSRADEYNYRIVKKAIGAKDSIIYKAFLSSIETDIFLNIWEDNGSSDRSYFFYKIDINPSGSKVTLSPVTENISEKFETSDQMKAFFKKYKSLSFFFGKDTEVFIKD